MILAYDEFVDFLAGDTTPQSVIDFRPSNATKERVADLIRRRKATALSADEAAALNQTSANRTPDAYGQGTRPSKIGREVAVMSVT